jgi:class 3 adenylate cyclase
MEKPSVDAGTSEVRKLVAIMFADMMGFTAMMQEDEAKAKLQRNHHIMGQLCNSLAMAL